MWQQKFVSWTVWETLDMESNSGPSMEPWGTPFDTGSKSRTQKTGLTPPLHIYCFGPKGLNL